MVFSFFLIRSLPNPKSAIRDFFPVAYRLASRLLDHCNSLPVGCGLSPFENLVNVSGSRAVQIGRVDPNFPLGASVVNRDILPLGV